MKCFRHRDRDAVGTCKACNKGVCEACAHDTGNGLACKETCVIEVTHMNEAMAKTIKLYGIGSNGGSLPIVASTFFFTGLVFMGGTAYSSISLGALDIFSALCSLAVLTIGFFIYRREKSGPS